MRPLIAALAILAAAVTPARAQIWASHPLPATGAFLDSAALADFVARHAPAGYAGKLALSFVMDSAGTVRTVRTLESALPADFGGTVRDSVAAFVRPQAPWPGGGWWLRLALQLGPAAGFRTERSREQAPRTIGSPLEIIAVASSGGPPVASGRIELRVLVGEDGRVLRVEPGPGNAIGRAESDRIGTQLHFTPGTVDGEPQRMWTTFRIQRSGAR